MKFWNFAILKAWLLIDFISPSLEQKARLDFEIIPSLIQRYYYKKWPLLLGHMVVKDTNRQKRQIGTQKNEPEKRGDKQEEKYMHVR